MSMPGFTAQSSLFTAAESYLDRRPPDSPGNAVIPANLSILDEIRLMGPYRACLHPLRRCRIWDPLHTDRCISYEYYCP